jgi:hypothetical protein
MWSPQVCAALERTWRLLIRGTAGKCNVLPKLQLTDDDADFVESEPPRGDIVTPTYAQPFPLFVVDGVFWNHRP